LLFAATWVGPRGLFLNKISQTEKDKYCMVLLIYGIFQNEVQLFEMGIEWWLIKAQGRGKGRCWPKDTNF
jgi:hypothetical protein